MNIVVHWHHVPPALPEAVRAGRCPGRIADGGPAPVFELATGFRQPLPTSLTDPEAAFAAMDEAGVDVVSPSIAPPLMHHDVDAEGAVALSRTVNDAFAKLKEASGGRMLPLANVPLQDPAAAVAELRRGVLELGLNGVAISTNVNGRNLGEPEFRPFWRAAAELETLVFLHPAQTPMGAGDRLCQPTLLNFVGFPVDTAVAVASLMFDGVYEDVGPLKTCFAHGGGAFPFIVSRWEHGYRQRVAPHQPKVRSPYAYLGSVYCDSLTHSDETLRFLIDLVGHDHVVLGNDFPFDMGDPQPVRTLYRAVTDEAVRRAIAGETAARLLGVAAPSQPEGSAQPTD